MLLDSHVVLWWVDASDKLGADARRLIESAPVVYVSAATVWELTIKSMIDRLELVDDFESRLWEAGFEALDVTPEHAAGIRAFPDLARHDPFDRLLLSQSRIEGIDLVTADRLLLGLGLEHLVDAGR